MREDAVISGHYFQARSRKATLASRSENAVAQEIALHAEI
jgi:hypothetical protein